MSTLPRSTSQCNIAGEIATPHSLPYPKSQTSAECGGDDEVCIIMNMYALRTSRLSFSEGGITSHQTTSSNSVCNGCHRLHSWAGWTLLASGAGEGDTIYACVAREQYTVHAFICTIVDCGMPTSFSINNRSCVPSMVLLICSCAVCQRGSKMGAVRLAARFQIDSRPQLKRIYMGPQPRLLLELASRSTVRMLLVPICSHLSLARPCRVAGCSAG
ncbi:hypothetical protein K437DRAFT_15226 [Tilletiaria anomala UBC 951]|uniref:Uncharacterized protein n=1 Tax=Tilletiaria anomala (strain ATCC 24038 / CBS 436.72 / UBC 951) TaxID=1037660 RepID=A0A066WNW1_TILAU|nr:uncharacterized protein K437DRAFT_15226 [Tilletiaria anomala UBC 951]KDN52295.1 hypothetical protein K437DRAFT_15226 [Tilletiaria anomala UBC 951]